MTFLRAAGLVLVLLLLVAVAGAWWYFFGPNIVPSAKLVPANSLLFISVPNAAAIGTGYETSQLKKIVDSPNLQRALDYLSRTLGPKNLDLLKAFAPNLSGQSFIALTHLDLAKREETGFVAAMKPKPGLDRFDTFVQQVNAAYPDLLRETKIGKGNLLGVDYQWIQGANSPGRVCVARYRGWIVTTWGEASLQDWLERMQGMSASPSLADNPDYQKSIARVGKDSQAIVYFDYHALVEAMMPILAGGHPAQADYLTKKLAGLGGAAVGSGFEGGNIVDHFSVLEPRQTQLDNGLSATPCPFDTLKFTGPNTRLYLAASVDWQQIWKSFQEQLSAGGAPLQGFTDRLNSWAKSENLDVQKNIIDPLGQEYSLQVEWDPDSTYPDVGFFLKVDKPDDFKPAIAALIATIRRDFSTSAVITEATSGGHTFASLKMVNPMPFAPTVIEDGPYFGVFLNEQHAVRSFSRDENAGLLHNDDFLKQIGDQRQGAAELIYFDGPTFLDHAYRTALPFVSMGAMFNPTLGSVLQGHQLPPDLSWLAPIGTWSAVIKTDDDGLTGYSTSGVGNQGIFLASGLGASAFALEMSGLLPRPQPMPTVPPSPPIAPPAIPPPVPPVAPVPVPPTPATNAVPVLTNAAPPVPEVAPLDTNAAPPASSNVPPAPSVTPPDSTH
jgi:hypothetical protein